MNQMRLRLFAPRVKSTGTSTMVTPACSRASAQSALAVMLAWAVPSR